jgi:hypothetical protein
MASVGTAVIIVDVLQVSLDLLDGGLGSYSGIGVTSAVEGNEVPGTEAERVSHVSEVADQELMTAPETQTEHSVSCVSVVLRTFHIVCVQNCLLVFQSVLLKHKFYIENRI